MRQAAKAFAQRGQKKSGKGGGLLLRPRQKRGVVVRVVATFPTKGKDLFTSGKTWSFNARRNRK